MAGGETEKKQKKTKAQRNREERERRIQRYGLQYERERSRKSTKACYVPTSQLSSSQRARRRKKGRERMRADRQKQRDILTLGKIEGLLPIKNEQEANEGCSQASSSCLQKSRAQKEQEQKERRIRIYGIEYVRKRAREKVKARERQLTTEQRMRRNKRARERNQAKRQKEREILAALNALTQSTNALANTQTDSNNALDKEERERRILLYCQEQERERARQAAMASYVPESELTPKEREKRNKKKRQIQKAMKEANERERGKLGREIARRTSKDPQRSIRNKRDRERRIGLYGLEYERERARQATKKSYIPSSQLTAEEREIRRKIHREQKQAYRAGKPIPKLKQKKKVLPKDAIDYQVLVHDL